MSFFEFHVSSPEQSVYILPDILSPNRNLKPSTNFACPRTAMQQMHVWFDVRVFYVRVSFCLLKEAPDSLLISYPQRDVSTELEVNGGRISPSEKACLALRRDRVDTESAEATYVSTNSIRTTGDLTFEIYDKDDLLVCGNLGRVHATPDEQLFEGYASVGTSPISNKAGWSMDCHCAITSPTSCFLRGRVDFSAHNSPSMEVYVAGRNAGLPIVLTQAVQLAARRRSIRCSTLDAIPEHGESQSDVILAEQIAEDREYSKMIKQLSVGLPTNFYASDTGYLEGEEGELSWFTAGVRVGVGIGLGMCLGIGIGVGLFIRTYQATTGPFRRRLF